MQTHAQACGGQMRMPGVCSDACRLTSSREALSESGASWQLADSSNPFIPSPTAPGLQVYT